MNLTLRHNGRVLIKTDRVIRHNNGLIAYNDKNVVKVIFNQNDLRNKSGSLLIDCRRVEGGDYMNEQEKDKYGVIEGENVLTEAEKAELENEMLSGNDDVHE